MSAAGVVVVHDEHGVAPHVLELAAELEMAGFAVAVVDLDDGVATTDPARAEGRARALAGPAALAAVTRAVGRLRDDGAAAVGAVGFSLGGSLVLRAAAEGDLDAVVAYCSAGSAPDAAATTCPVQLHLAGSDGVDPAGAVRGYVAALESAGTPVDTFLYPGTVHGFANLDGPTGDRASAEVAQARTIGFLNARVTR